MSFAIPGLLTLASRFLLLVQYDTISHALSALLMSRVVFQSTESGEVYQVPVKVDQGLLDLCVTVAARPDHVPGRGALLELCEKLFYIRTKVSSEAEQKKVNKILASPKGQTRRRVMFCKCRYLTSTARFSR